MVPLFRLSLIGKVSAAKDPEPPGFRVRSHDLLGPLPEIVAHDSGDRTEILVEISREAAKLNATAWSGRIWPPRIPAAGPAAHGPRRRRGCRDASGGKDAAVGAPTFWQAYGKVRRRALRKLP